MSLKGSLLLLKGCRDRGRPGCCGAAVADDSLLQITFYFLFSFFSSIKNNKSILLIGDNSFEIDIQML